MLKLARLDDRALIQIAGAEARPFLNNLLSQDVETLQPGELRYAALLTPQGRLLHDLFLLGREDGVWIDVAAIAGEDLLRRLTLYRLRAKVGLQPLEAPVYAAWSDTAPPPQGEGDRAEGVVVGAAAPDLADAGPLSQARLPPSLTAPPEGEHRWLPDPRTPALGWRAYGGEHAATADADDYDAHRVAQGVPDAARDGLTDSAYPIEADLDLLNGIDFHKGCFVGQETTSRMKRRGQIKTRLMPLVVEGATPGAEVLNGERRAGEVAYARPGRALALLRLDRLDGDLTVDGRPARVERPAWLAIGLPP